MQTPDTPDTPQTPEQALSASLQAQQPPQQKPARAAGKPRAKSGKAPRSLAREFTVQALYQYLVGKNDAAAIDAFTRDLSGFHKCDMAHFDALFHGCVDQAEQLDALITPHLDRSWPEISPIEHAVMWIGVYEFRHCPDVPWRVVLNECFELAKSFGGTDGHKYVNGILHALASQLRATEVAHDSKPRA